MLGIYNNHSTIIYTADNCVTVRIRGAPAKNSGIIWSGCLVNNW